MLKIYKQQGVSLIELMVAVGLGLALILSMLAFYSISSQNVINFQTVTHDQQQIRKMMNLLETDIENVGGFECASPDNIFKRPIKAFDFYRVPTDIISLGDNLSRKQIIFLHPIITEYQHTALGMLEFKKTPTPSKLSKYTPALIHGAECGEDKSSVYIGSTILEMIPINNITINPQFNASANNIWAFVALSSAQSRRIKDSQNTELLYSPKMDDATVLFLSDNSNTPAQKEQLPFGTNTVDILLGFSPVGDGNTHVPDDTLSNAQDLLNGAGGWVNPFESQTNYELLVDITDAAGNTPQPNLLSKELHSSVTDGEGANINTYPLKTELIKRVRAIKFQFTFGAHDGLEARTLTRVIRFKNTHLMPN